MRAKKIGGIGRRIKSSISVRAGCSLASAFIVLSAAAFMHWSFFELG
jgi:hypothetical protein